MRARIHFTARQAPIALFVLTACTLKGDGEPVELTREVPPFTAIEVFNDFEVEVVISPELAADATVTLHITGEKNLAERLFTEVHGEEVLSIGFNPNLMTRPTLTAKVTLEVPALTSVFATDDARVTVIGASGELALAGEKRSVIEGSELTGVVATVLAGGAAQVMLAGAGPQVTIEARDAALVSAARLQADAASVNVVDATASVTVCTTGAVPELLGEVEQVMVLCE